MERNDKKTILQRDENRGWSPWRTLCRWWGLCPCLARSQEEQVCVWVETVLITC
jgi:hypothetical protein